MNEPTPSSIPRTAAPHSIAPGSSAAKGPRIDLYGPPHKMIRFLLANVLVELGRTCFGDPEQAKSALANMEQCLAVCDAHIAHEDVHVRPALAERAPTSIATLDAEHEEHAVHVAELRGLARALGDAATPELRTSLGHTIYLHFSVFVAETLAHAAYEERVVQPLCLRLFTAEELLAIHHAILASIPPAEMMLSLRAMIPASNREERAALLESVRGAAGDGALIAIFGVLAELLPAADLADLRARLGVV